MPDMIAFSNAEVAEAEWLGETVDCPRCFIPHKVKTSYGEGVDNSDPLRLHYYMCNGTAYLAGINGKDMMHRTSKPPKKKREKG